MPPSNAMENDKKRLRNQFTKDERTRLLGIMTEYGPLLDDKNISILSRKEIWEIIENKFNENGHSGRTSAQLKKYWQNYKYHSKRTKVIHKEVPKPLSPMTKQMVRMLAKVNPEEWAQYDVSVNSSVIKKSPRSSPSRANSENIEREEEGGGDFSSSPATSKVVNFTPPESIRSSSKSGVEASLSSNRESLIKRENSESNVVVSTTEVPGSSVTVSVICPEVSSTKGRTSIFWKRNNKNQSDKLCPAMLKSSYVNNDNNKNNDNNSHETERIVDGRSNSKNDDFSSEFKGNSDNFNRQGINDSLKNYKRRLNVVGILPKKNDSSNSKIDNQTLISRKRESKNQVVGLVEEIKNYNLMETLGSVSTTMINGRVAAAVLNRSSTINEELDCSDFTEMIQKLITVKESLNRNEIFNEIIENIEEEREEENEEEEQEEEQEEQEEEYEEDDDDKMEKKELETLNKMMKNNEVKKFSTKDIIWLKLYLRLLQKVGSDSAVTNNKSDGNRETSKKFEPLISRMNLNDEKNDNDESSENSERDDERDKIMEVDEDNSGNKKLRIRRDSLMTQNADETDQLLKEVKIENEGESETENFGQNENAEDNRVINPMNSLIEVKLECAKLELDHQLKLQKLEMEEKELRVRIAEMTIQETRLRIQSLMEERRRATELHELRLAQMAAEKVRSEAEHAARLEASCTTTAEGRARINSIERDRERSENFYQMQLRCMSAAGTSTKNLNSSNINNCKPYHQQ